MIRKLFDDYVYWRTMTAHYQNRRANGPFAVGLRFTKDREEGITKMYDFCRTNRLDPRKWLCFLFVLRNWRIPPMFNELAPKKHIEKFRAFGSIPELDWKLKAEQPPPENDPNKDLIASNEAIKSRLQREGQSYACLCNTNERLGYHPRSPVCSTCPVKRTCETITRKRFNFDIVGLRAGRVSVEDARHAAYYRR